CTPYSCPSSLPVFTPRMASCPTFAVKVLRFFSVISIYLLIPRRD
ncbi:MAG: hypothetical protein, partial [Olavius algarvensis Gamma 1 endosymbiont]